MQNTDHLAVLRRAGAALIVLGLLDIGYMIYCIANGQSYSSSLNIFAVIAGAFLYRGNLTSVRLLTFFLAFVLAGFGVVLVILPFMQPLDLWEAQFRLNPKSLLSWFLITFIVLSALLWVYLQLRSAAVLAARVAAGQSNKPPVLAFVTGVTLVLVLGVVVRAMMQGPEGERAKQLAEAQVGPGYRFYVSSMQWSRGQHRASVTAYNTREIKTVQVEWQE